MPFEITSIICTHNRCDRLPGAVESLVSQDLPGEAYEVLVVDNGSTDDTREICSDLVSRHENVRYVYEDSLGLSYARNRGVAEAGGTYVAFLDDDARARADWLSAILRVFREVDPRPGCVSGKILPEWEVDPPEWMNDRLKGQLALQDWGDRSHFIGENEWFAGASLAYEKETLLSAGAFDPDLGRIGDNLLSMEEDLLRCRIESAGKRYFYDPGIVARHFIKKERLKKEWFEERAYWNGFSNAVLDRKMSGTGRSEHVLKALSTAARIVLSMSDLRALIGPADRDDVFHERCSVLSRIGYINGVFRRIS
jgi:glycosyltransferase involved in cell wall biosynthesis